MFIPIIFFFVFFFFILLNAAAAKAAVEASAVSRFLVISLPPKSEESTELMKNVFILIVFESCDNRGSRRGTRGIHRVHCLRYICMEIKRIARICMKDDYWYIYFDSKQFSKKNVSFRSNDIIYQMFFYLPAIVTVIYYTNADF